MKNTNKTNKNGQGMVEFALVLPILLLLVIGLIEAGRLIFMYSAVISASREAVRYGVTTGTNASGTPLAQDCDGMRAAARKAATIVTLEDSDIVIQYDNGPGTAVLATCSGSTTSFEPQSGNRLVVTISTQYEPAVPLVPLGPLTISSTAARTYIGQIDIE